MSISVDDLVSSLGASHVSQEAMDLATLQSQLAQALIGLSRPPVNTQSSSPSTQPCNTPTGRTPSNSISWGPMVVQRTPTLSRQGTDDCDDMEDERMVEDILIPNSPSPTAPSSNALFGSHQQQPAWAGTQSRRSFSASSPSFDLFTTADPFYNAQIQALQNHSNSTSVMAQLGRPSQQSPFMTTRPNNYSPPVDTQPFIFATY